MTIEEFLNKIVEASERRHSYQIVIPMEREGDIDEIDTYAVRSLTWDDADKRVILEW